MTHYLLGLFIFFPLVALVASLALPKTWEKAISVTTTSGIALNTLLFAVFCTLWAKEGFTAVVRHGLTLFSNNHYTFSVDFYFDATSAIFYGVTCLMTLMIIVFSRYYMHRDPGYKRFHSTVLVFFIGLTLIILSGNFETFFLGWEFIGISSFLLIAFYRDRFLPAKNALKVFTIYRIADAFFLAALWYSHHIFEKSIHFSEFTTLAATQGHQLAILSILLLVVAIIKSAQFPFSYWLPRAMEGPTTSSAIFYGALAVHMGVFVLLRTFPLWEDATMLRVGIFALGIFSAVIASNISKVQSSIKTQIAYSSITQIGIMFAEIALGLHWLALIHFVSNAALRTYQLLISPSVVGYMIHEQFFYFVTPKQRIAENFFGRIQATAYVLGVKEWNMDKYFTNYIWKPFKAIGRTEGLLDHQIIAVTTTILILGGYILLEKGFGMTPLPILSALTGLLSVMYYVRAFTTKTHPNTAWNCIFAGHFLGILFLSDFFSHSHSALFMYSTGIAIAFVVGHLCLAYLAKQGEKDELMEYHGHMYEHSILGNVFFIACLAYMAFPITPSFLGQEILLSHIEQNHGFRIALFSVGYVISGVAIMRIYAKTFFGPHDKTYHEIAYKSA